MIFATWGYVNAFGPFRACYTEALAPLSPRPSRGSGPSRSVLPSMSVPSLGRRPGHLHSQDTGRPFRCQTMAGCGVVGTAQSFGESDDGEQGPACAPAPHMGRCSSMIGNDAAPMSGGGARRARAQLIPSAVPVLFMSGGQAEPAGSLTVTGRRQAYEARLSRSGPARSSKERGSAH